MEDRGRDIRRSGNQEVDIMGTGNQGMVDEGEIEYRTTNFNKRRRTDDGETLNPKSLSEF
jgi:hypothetical protein